MAINLTIDLPVIERIVREYNPLEIALALVHHATLSTVDMMNDMIIDQEYVKENGLPSKAELTNRIFGWIIDVMPEILGDELQEEYKKATEETKLECIFRALLTEHIKQNPSLLALEYQPR